MTDLNNEETQREIIRTAIKLVDDCLPEDPQMRHAVIAAVIGYEVAAFSNSEASGQLRPDVAAEMLIAAINADMRGYLEVFDNTISDCLDEDDECEGTA